MAEPTQSDRDMAKSVKGFEWRCAQALAQAREEGRREGLEKAITELQRLADEEPEIPISVQVTYEFAIEKIRALPLPGKEKTE